MKGKVAIYLGRIVDKKLFRTFVYGVNGEKKLVESWEAFEAAMESGIWFATEADAKAVKSITDEQKVIDSEQAENSVEVKEKSKSKAKPKAKAKNEPVNEIDDSDSMLANDGSVFEVTDGA